MSYNENMSAWVTKKILQHELQWRYFSISYKEDFYSMRLQLNIPDLIEFDIWGEKSPFFLSFFLVFLNLKGIEF